MAVIVDGWLWLWVGGCDCGWVWVGGCDIGRLVDENYKA